MTQPPPSRRSFLRRVCAGGAAAGAALQPALAAPGRDASGRQASGPFLDRGAFPVAARAATLRPLSGACRGLMDLSGLWAFRPDADGQGLREGWQRSGLSTAVRLAVPGSWNEQLEELRDFEGFGWYETSFTVPLRDADSRVVLRVDSAVYEATLWLDGKAVGRHSGGHLPFEFEITALVRPGQAQRLTILVDARLLPDRVPMGGASAPGHAGTEPDVPYDFFPYAGLHRAVTLALLPPVHLRDVTATTRLEGADAVLLVEAVADGGWNGQGTIRLSAEGREAVDARVTFRNGTARAELRQEKARLWRPEDPHLQTLTVTLERPDGTLLDSYALSVGLRTVSVSGDRLLLNGQPIRLLGASRHEDFPVNGRGLNLPVAVRDMSLLRWIGGNSFRTSHYPCAEETLDLADRMGLLVIAEIPAVDLAFCDGDAALAARLAQCKQDITELVARDKNRPSIILWSLANEPQDDMAAARGGMAIPPGNNAAARGLAFFRSLFAHARTLDSTRPFTLVGMDHSDPSWVELGDVMSLNRYPGWYDDPGRLDRAVPHLAAELEAIHKAHGKPILIAEFGADAIPGQHDEPAALWSEEYEADTVAAVAGLMTAGRPWLVGLHVWCLCDFRTSQAVRRPASLNLKGLFTRDREPKMAARRLRQLWNGA